MPVIFPHHSLYRWILCGGGYFRFLLRGLSSQVQQLFFSSLLADIYNERDESMLHGACSLDHLHSPYLKNRALISLRIFFFFSSCNCSRDQSRP